MFYIGKPYISFENRKIKILTQPESKYKNTFVRTRSTAMHTFTRNLNFIHSIDAEKIVQLNFTLVYIGNRSYRKTCIFLTRVNSAALYRKTIKSGKKK